MPRKVPSNVRKEESVAGEKIVRRNSTLAKKRHTIKHQLIINSSDKKIIATAMDSGSTHDFKIYKESKTHIHPEKKIQSDSGYQGIQKIHARAETPKKMTKQKPLTKYDKRINRTLSQKRIAVEHAIRLRKEIQNSQ